MTALRDRASKEEQYITYKKNIPVDFKFINNIEYKKTGEKFSKY